MKQTTLLFVMVFGLVFVFSCKNDSLIESDNLNELELIKQEAGAESDQSMDYNSMNNVRSHSVDVVTFERLGVTYLQGGIGVSCTTESCEGNNEEHCKVGWRRDPNRIECSCSGCVMTLTLDAYNTNIDVWNQINSEDINYDHFTNYVSEKHGYKIENFNRIDFNFQPFSTTIVYSYELVDGTEETLMFLNEYRSDGEPGKKYKIDCVGECGCREIFDFNTNKAECSCDPCTLDVEIIETGG